MARIVLYMTMSLDATGSSPRQQPLGELRGGRRAARRRGRGTQLAVPVRSAADLHARRGGRVTEGVKTGEFDNLC